MKRVIYQSNAKINDKGILEVYVKYNDGTSGIKYLKNIIMENQLNRNLKKYETVVCIDGDETNTNLNNLKVEFVSHPNLKIDYFDNIDTVEKAYWLGFLFADGCILDKNNNLKFQLGLSIKDKDHFELFCDTLGFDKTKIYETKGYDYTHTTAGKLLQVKTGITSFIESLIKYGIVPRKSLIVEYPIKFLNTELLNYAFIYGYFDGDGNINKCNYSITIYSGSFNFLNSIKTILNLNSNVYKGKTCYTLGINSKIAKLLFDSFPNGLKRKREIYYIINDNKIVKQKEIQDKIDILNNTNIDKTKRGWKTIAAKLIGTECNQFKKWCMRHYPEYYNENNFVSNLINNQEPLLEENLNNLLIRS